MNKRLAVAAAVLLAGALLFFLRSKTPAPAPAAEPLGLANPRIPGQDQAAPMPSLPPLPPREVEGRARQVALDRPPPSQYPSGLKPLTPPDAPTGPVDKRGGPATPNAKRQMEIIGYAFQTLEEDVEDCLKQWDGAAPGQAQEVMIAFEIDEAGLQRSWLEHEGEVPFGPRSCLANAVYGLDWSKIVDHPAKLTQRYTLARDGGVEATADGRR